MKKICKISAMMFTVLGLGFASSSSALAATVVWTFNLPATGSYSGSYPEVATLSLTQNGSNVDFFLILMN